MTGPLRGPVAFEKWCRQELFLKFTNFLFQKNAYLLIYQIYCFALHIFDYKISILALYLVNKM